MFRALKIGIVGCGAVGSYYGARLACAGHTVHFLLRSDYDAVARDGARIESVTGNFTARPVPARTPAEIGVCDLVLVALKTTANDQLEALVTPLVDSSSVVITLQNGLGNEEALVQFMDPIQVMGGLCFVCLNRIAPGVIVHQAHGQVVLGDLVPRGDSRREQLAEIFQHAAVPCRASANLTQARWEKLIWNIPFNGLGVASAAGIDALEAGRAPEGIVAPCLTTDRLIGDARWAGIVRELMHEVVRAARAQNLPVSFDLVEKQLELTRNMGPYKPSTLLDFERKQALELESMFAEPLRRAKAAGAATPLLEKLCGVLRDLEQANRAAANA